MVPYINARTIHSSCSRILKRGDIHSTPRVYLILILPPYKADTADVSCYCMHIGCQQSGIAVCGDGGASPKSILQRDAKIGESVYTCGLVVANF